jgi:hypothetical protein
LVLSRREGTQVWLQVTPPTCQTDLGFGDGPILEVCGGDLSLGNDAQLALLGAPPMTPTFVAIGPAASPTTFLGTTVVPFPPTAVFAFATDLAGELKVAIPGGGGPATIVVQSFQLGTQLTASNAVELKFLP